MTAIVAFAGVSITRVSGSHYDGFVKFRAESDNIKFDYAYTFGNASSIEVAVANGAAFLKNELDQLSSATQSIYYGG
jgi:hypothetical protein